MVDPFTETTVQDATQLRDKMAVNGLNDANAIAMVCAQQSHSLPQDSEEAKKSITSLRNNLSTLTGSDIAWAVNIKNGKVQFVARLAGGFIPGVGIRDGKDASTKLASHLSELFDETGRTMNADFHHTRFDNSALTPPMANASMLAIEFSDIPASLDQSGRVIEDIREKNSSVIRHVESKIKDAGISQFSLGISAA